MSREILFRGKTENGEWICGDLIHDQERFSSVRICIQKEYSTGTFYNCIAPRVISSTVGQFTGLTDKNGKKIFEGDIVRDISRNGELLGEYGFSCGRFELNWRKFEKYSIEYGFSLSLEEMGSTVIGNIHDNPELLKGGGQ